ncbi:hypothetical protein [Sorangium sp. So ce117]
MPHTFHWGQCLRGDYDLERLQATFGARVDDWLAAMFANALVERCGIGD